VSNSSASGQLQIQHEHRTTATKQIYRQKATKQTKSFHVRFKHKFLIIYVDLQTALAAEEHLAEGQ
jgi:hypothetical protein